MTHRTKLTREDFIAKGIKQNAWERRTLGVPAQIQIDPEQAWEALYGRRGYVYLEVDRSLVPFGGKPMIVDDDVGNGFYGDRE